MKDIELLENIKENLSNADIIKNIDAEIEKRKDFVSALENIKYLLTEKIPKIPHEYITSVIDMELYTLKRRE